MSDNAPPAWLDDAPPPSSEGQGRPPQGGGDQRPKRQKMKPEEAQALAIPFYEWLSSRETREQLRMTLPDTIDPDKFISNVKTAVMNNPELLREDLRQSLYVAVAKAAMSGLRPDGKEGILTTRWDNDKRGHIVVWQPMVWGICKLGRETGAIKSIRAHIVFTGEKFRIIQGEEDIIEHEVDIDLVDAAYAALNGGMTTGNFRRPVSRPDAFLERVKAAYCFITGPDGTVTRRYMTRQRILSLRDSSSAPGGPWSGRFVDEMVLKSVILFTSKWVNLNPDSVEAKRFQSALMTDMEIDFDRTAHAEALEHNEPQRAALPPPSSKLHTLESMLTTREKEAVPAGGRQEPEPPPPPPPAAGAGDEPAKVPPADRINAEINKAKAASWTSTFLLTLQQRIEAARTSGREDLVKRFLSSPGHQKQIALFKEEQKDQYNRIINACTDNQIIGVVGELSTAYPEFYDAVTQRREASNTH